MLGKVLIEILLIALFCNGLQLASEEGMIFHRIARKIKSWPEWINKPIIGCIYCMASVWGTIIHTAFNYNNIPGMVTLPIVIVASVYLNGLVGELLALLQEVRDNLYNKNNPHRKND
jgi:hypothetical protein